MNLHGIVRVAISRVNPYVDAQIYKSVGYTIDDSRKQIPKYEQPVSMRVQKQAIKQEYLQHIDNISQQGQLVSIYTDGNWCGMNRNKSQSGDKFVIGGETWLVILVPEIWPDWTMVIACLQAA
jgi:hypothetical protein